MSDDSEQNSSTSDANGKLGFRLVAALGALSVVLSLGVIAALIGWPIPESGFFWIGAGTKCATGTLFLQEILRIIFRNEPVFRFFAKHFFEAILLLFSTGTFLAAFFAGTFLSVLNIGDGAGTLKDFLASPNFFAAISAIVLAVQTLRGIRARHAILGKLPLNPGRVFILSFLLLITAGTLLLKTPNASVSGMSWCDAIFLATSAVCVTGLSPFDIALELTFRGQCIVLTLAQLGGLGVMSITYFFAYFFTGGLSLRNRFDFRDLFSEENIGQIGTVLAVVIGFTATAEAIGAVAIYFSTYDLEIVGDRPIFFAVFHSISAFCNAGLSSVHGGLALPELRENVAMLSTVSAMALVGGLGFPVIKNFWQFFIDRAGTKLRRKKITRVPVRLTTHTKIVLVTTAGIFVFGFLAFYLLDWVDWGKGSLRRAFFLASTSRTAGFDIEDTSGISAAAKMLLMGLMFIGGSPFSTAGGIKTTTFAVAVLSLRKFVLGRSDLEVFGRRLGNDVANQALAIVLLGAGATFFVTVSLCALHPEIDFLSLAFESVSAVGTVGLSCGVTEQLGEPAKYLLATTMFVGRIGILLFITSFLPKKKSDRKARLPETSIVLS